MAYDIIGSREKAVAIISPDEENPKKLAKEIMDRHKNVKTVLQKTSGRSGIYRLYQTKIIKGSRNTEVIHKEHGYLLKLDPKYVYFSPREATERKRIAEKVKPGERVLVMFSGIGPFGIAIAKKQPKVKEVVCVEINLKAFEYAEQNVKLNKLNGKVKNYCWDVRDAKGLGTFDRIIMPLPEKAWEFLDVAYSCSKKGTTIHLYGISGDKKNFSDFIDKIKDFSKTHNLKFRIVGKQKVLPYAPGRWKVRIDLKVLK